MAPRWFGPTVVRRVTAAPRETEVLLADAETAVPTATARSVLQAPPCEPAPAKPTRTAPDTDGLTVAA